MGIVKSKIDIDEKVYLLYMIETPLFAYITSKQKLGPFIPQKMITKPPFYIQKVHLCTKQKIYSNTVFLPKTKFPLRPDKNAADRNDFINKYAAFDKYYDWQRSHLFEPEFVLHDGPPYANGKPHMGHAINKILKDTILRYNIIKGNKIHFVPGWDCHGLPIELKAISDRNLTNPIEIRSKARKFAETTVNQQREVFKSWGCLGDWKNAYKTFNIDYVKTQSKQFFKLYKKGLIFRDVKPVFWSPSSNTALAEAELEYNEKHLSPSLYARFKVKEIPQLNSGKTENIYVIIWTTTPWTLPANSSVCYNERFSYSLIQKSDDKNNNLYLTATDLIPSLSRAFNCNFDIVETFPGSTLENSVYFHPIFKEKLCKFLHSSHVTIDKGTGLVHAAPAHGPEDFLLAVKNNIEIPDLVDETGCYNSNAGPLLKGKFVLDEGNKTVTKLIKEDIINLTEIQHSYPYDWRTKQPVILRLSKQWFINTDIIKTKTIDALDNVEIIPENYKKDLIKLVKNRPFWCISRQRKWGVPIPVFYDTDTGNAIINENTLSHHMNLLEKHGTDFWWKLPKDELLPTQIHPCRNIEQGEDIMDIWLDSGLSWSKVLEGSKIADLYLEGVDQLRGWFQSSLLTSMAIRDKPPFKKIYVHGFAVDKNGVKMSKSLGNVIDPNDVINRYGIDALRWWVVCHVNDDTLACVNENVLKSSVEEVQKIRHAIRFALGALTDINFDFIESNLNIIDRYMLHQLCMYHKEINESFESYKFHKISQITLNFITNSISAMYYSAIKDRLYCDEINSENRRNAQFVLWQIFEIVTLNLAPIVPHLAEEFYYYLPVKNAKCYFKRNFNDILKGKEDDEVAEIMDVLLECKRELNKMFGANITNCEVNLSFPKKFYGKLNKYDMENCSVQNQLEDIFQAGKVVIKQSESIVINEKFNVEVEKLSKFSCPRCRKFKSEKQDCLCSRCYEVVQNLNENKVHIKAYIQFFLKIKIV